jgi:hypothetical protein
LDNRFPLGVATYTGTGGGNNVISGLTTSVAGAHTHVVPHSHGAGTLKTEPDTGYFRADGSNTHVSLAGHTHVISGETAVASPTTDSQGNHTHVISSDGSWLPPYLGITFCKKD